MRRDLGLLALRLGTGAILMAHGYPKLFGGEGKTPPAWAARLLGPNYPGAVAQGGLDNFAKALDQLGVPSPRAAALAAGLAELGGGLALIVGLGTELTSTVLVGNMAVAARKAHWPQGFYGQGGWEYAAALGVAAATLALTGPGAFSFDQALRVNAARR